MVDDFFQLEDDEPEKKPDSCTEEYAAMEDSTMCVSNDHPEATDVGVSDEEKKIVLVEHNKFRSGVNPTASNMYKMVCYWKRQNLRPGGLEIFRAACFFFISGG